jgi:hypothetical protein
MIVQALIRLIGRAVQMLVDRWSKNQPVRISVRSMYGRIVADTVWRRRDRMLRIPLRQAALFVDRGLMPAG